MSRVLVGAALAILAGCGSNGSSTTLTIQVGDSAGSRVYRLQCAPAKGTTRNPQAICAALRRQPNMLTDPRAVVCGPASAPSERIKVSGSFRGKPVHAEFQDVCHASGDGVGAWIDVLEGA